MTNRQTDIATYRAAIAAKKDSGSCRWGIPLQIVDITPIQNKSPATKI